MPRTYWSEYPFYQIVNGLRWYYKLGHRPEDLAHVETIEKKVWRKHEVHLKRLLDIVRQGEERLQLARFQELMEEFSGHTAF